MSAAPRTPVVPGQWHPALPDAEECRRRFDGLQPRQRQVIELHAMGWPTKEIARRLGIGAKTVYDYLNAAAEALEVRPPTPAVVALYWRAQQAELAVDTVAVKEPLAEVVVWHPRSALELSATELASIRRAG